MYTTGLRLKCARFEFDGVDSWRLTDAINKNVSKRDIIMILDTLRRCGERKYKMEPNEYIQMLKKVTVAVNKQTSQPAATATSNGQPKVRTRMLIWISSKTLLLTIVQIRVFFGKKNS